MKASLCHTGSLASRCINRFSLFSFGLAWACSALTECTPPIQVVTVIPKPIDSSPDMASDIGFSVSQLHHAYRELKPDAPISIHNFNYQTARLIECLDKHPGDPWTETIQIKSNDATYSLTGIRPKRLTTDPSKLIPTDTLSFKGAYAQHGASVEGIGAPVLAVGQLNHLGHLQYRKHLPIQTLTALVRFEGRNITLKLIDPYQQSQATIKQRAYPLAANYSASVMYGLSKGRIDKLGITRLLRPSKYKDTAQLNFLQPYDSKRIPVLLVHGLDSTPATYAPMLFDLLKDPAIRNRYQFWAFSYPSGYPYNYSASLLRRELDEIQSFYPETPKMVIIGHSMGSLISRLMVTNAGDQLWKTAFGKPIKETQIAGRSKQILIDCLVFDSRSEITRAIFICGPHRGSKLASQPVRKLSSKLIRLPGFMADVRDKVVNISTMDTAAYHISKAPTSIDTLSPNNPFIRAVDQIPIASHVRYHSIIGDRGKGDTPDSSDGVVEYWSSHLDGAQSEKIVPRNHSAHQHPEAIQEVRRILRHHK